MAKGIAGLAVRARNEGPAWIDRAVSAGLASEAWPLRTLRSLLARGHSVPPPLLPEPGAGLRVLFGPFNYAGQAYLWARSLERAAHSGAAPGISARCFATSAGGFSFAVDQVVPGGVFIGSETWQQRQHGALGAYSHVVIESFGSLLGKGTGQVILREIRDLRDRGVQVALLCHGSDIRSPRAHAARTPDLPLSEWGPTVKRLQRGADENRQVLDAFDGPVFVSTPDLLLDVPEATLLPVVVDLERWAVPAAGDAESGTGGPAPHATPVVMHIPSNASLKGSTHVDRAATGLAERGLIRYERLSNIAAAEMPATIAGADIVVDQLLLGSYGVAACEAMAAGRVVVGNVSDQVREAVRIATGHELPIVQATPHTLGRVLTELAGSAAARNEVGTRGAEFVRAVHSGIETPRAMADFLGFGGHPSYTP